MADHGLRIVREDQIRAAVAMPDAIEAVRAAFLASANERVHAPEVVGVELPEEEGEFHIKAAHIQGSRFFVVKVASGYFQNPDKGLPVGNGLMIAFDARTGAPSALLLDNGFLTDLRTGAAGAVAADCLARRTVAKAAILGAGVQGRHQLRGLATVRRLE